MSAEVESAMIANSAAWWDRAGEFVNDGLMDGDEVLPLSQTDWQVDLVPIEFMGNETDWSLVVRDRDDKVLSCVGPEYTPLQNEELVAYMKALVDSSDLMFESGLSLKGGKVVAFCARRPEPVRIAGEDYLDYLTGANWHDGTRKAKLYFSNVRTVCCNTLNAGIASAPNVFGFRHVGNMESRMEEARKTLEMGFSYTEELRKIGEDLVLKPMNPTQYEEFLKAAVPDPKQNKATEMATVIRARDKIRAVYRDTPDLENIRETRWGALQGMLAYNDHSRGFRNQDNRFETVVLSQNENTQRALDYLLKA